MEILWVFKKSKRGQVERGVGKDKRSKSGGEKEKKKGGGWSPATCKYPDITRLFPGPPEKGGLELGPTRTKIRVLCQEKVEALAPDSYQGTGKNRIG